MANRPQVTLPPPNTDQGAMARLFLLEAVSPGMPGYTATENLPAMRLMRQTIENRLKSPAEYGAAGAQTETDIVELGNQFAGFGAYPTLDAGMLHNLAQIMRWANDPHWPTRTLYAQFVGDALTAASESVMPPVAMYADVTAWKTAGSASPGPRFRALTTLSGNTFYATNPVPPMPHKHAKQSRRHGG